MNNQNNYQFIQLASIKNISHLWQKVSFLKTSGLKCSSDLTSIENISHLWQKNIGKHVKCSSDITSFTRSDASPELSKPSSSTLFFSGKLAMHKCKQNELTDIDWRRGHLPSFIPQAGHCTYDLSIYKQNLNVFFSKKSNEKLSASISCTTHDYKL